MSAMIDSFNATGGVVKSPASRFGASVGANPSRVLFSSAFLFSLHSRRTVALADGGRFLVMLPPAGFGKNAGFFTGTTEPAQINVEWFVSPYFYIGHGILPPAFDGL
jgi:hypothetical protein